MKSLSRTNVCMRACAIALALIGLVGPAFAQTSADQNHAAHHPQTGAEAAQTTPSTPEPSQAPGASKGMMGQGGMMLGQGDQGGMMMSGDMQQMMSMMRDMMTMMSAQSGMMALDVEGRIASLKAQLKITDAQATPWNRFAEALRGVAKTMNEAHGQMMHPGGDRTLPARLEHQERMLAAHLTSVQALKGAVVPLYASFSNEQKKIADGVMIGPMGMM